MLLQWANAIALQVTPRHKFYSNTTYFLKERIITMPTNNSASYFKQITHQLVQLVHHLMNTEKNPKPMLGVQVMVVSF